MSPVNIKTDYSWKQEALEWYSLPQDKRDPKTVTAFCEKFNIARRTFYEVCAKTDFQKELLKKQVFIIKDRAPEVLNKLAQNALEGKEKSIEMYLRYMLEIAEKMDLKIDGKEDLEKALNILNKKIDGERTGKDNKSIQDRGTGSEAIGGTNADIQGDSGVETQESSSDMPDSVR